MQTYRDEVVKRVYIGYQQMLLTNNAVDFDDLLLYTASLLEDNPAVRERYARRYEHVLVDEFQDTNLAQYALLRQAYLPITIISLRLAMPTNRSIAGGGQITAMCCASSRIIPDAQIILLGTKLPLHPANPGCRHGSHRPQPKPHTQNSYSPSAAEGLKVILHETYDDRQEASFIVDTIASLVGRKQIKPGDVAVMYRTNAQSRLLEEAFLHAGLPYKLVGAQRFYGRREVKDIIAYMRLVHNPDDEPSLIRVINVPPRGSG